MVLRDSVDVSSHLKSELSLGCNPEQCQKSQHRNGSRWPKAVRPSGRVSAIWRRAASWITSREGRFFVWKENWNKNLQKRRMFVQKWIFVGELENWTSKYWKMLHFDGKPAGFKSINPKTKRNMALRHWSWLKKRHVTPKLGGLRWLHCKSCFACLNFAQIGSACCLKKAEPPDGASYIFGFFFGWRSDQKTNCYFADDFSKSEKGLFYSKIWHVFFPWFSVSSFLRLWSWFQRSQGIWGTSGYLQLLSTLHRRSMPKTSKPTRLGMSSVKSSPCG